MKIIIALLLVFSPFIFADNTQANRKIVVLEDGTIASQIVEEEKLSKMDRDMLVKNCEALSVFAKSSFKARQNGISAAKIFKIISGDSQSAKQMMEMIVVDVFSKPLIESPKLIDVAASEYANSFFIKCASA